MGSSADSRYHVCKKCFEHIDLNHSSVSDHACDLKKIKEKNPIEYLEKAINKASKSITVVVHRDGTFSRETINYIDPKKLIRELKKGMVK